MTFKYYQISKYRSVEETFDTEWESIEDFFKEGNNLSIDEYIRVENNFVKFLRKFYDYFSRKPTKKTQESI
ncbi:hypothetical protein F9B74_10100 [Pelistega sp. NLN82]|uniref:Uncharacterized protein n=1 Tax=Pelistega ratti TaxID=2652177 RepID=A0A6L9YA03_9BURK|nr:hypothetical protein [Pelistega ratti]NEN76648.1 hypothetical protein [Pelistega ratti]